jgi:pimeloyl-ACP methyl ester carboxylesterase
LISKRFALKLFSLLVFLALGACGPPPDEDGDVVAEPGPSEADAVQPPELQDREDSFAEVNGTRLFYEARGSGPSLVLISGANLDSRLWDELFGELAERFRVVRYDPRGTGKSNVPEELFSHYEDLHALLDFLKVETTHLLGFSFGGGVALDFAVQYPERVRSLILVSPGLSSWKDELTPVLAGLSEVAEKEGRAKAIELLLTDPSMPTAEHKEARELMRAILEDSPRLFDSGFAYLRLMEPLDPPVEARLTEIKVPTLLIAGERDNPAIHQNVDTLQEGIVGARKALVMGVGHVVGLEHAAELRRIVLDFLGAD